MQIQTQEIIVIPPTHEQTTPSYHVSSDIVEPFLSFLKSRGVTAWQPPEETGKAGPRESRVIEIEIEAGTPTETLEAYIRDFHATRCRVDQ